MYSLNLHLLQKLKSIVDLCILARYMTTNDALNQRVLVEEVSHRNYTINPI